MVDNTDWQMLTRQKYPLDMKVSMTMDRIKNWYQYWDGEICIAFSGGASSRMLLGMARSLYPKIPGVYVYGSGDDNGVLGVQNIIWLKNNTFDYRLIQERLEFKPMLGTTLDSGPQSLVVYRDSGCQSIKNERPVSHPIAFWTKQDILEVS